MAHWALKFRRSREKLRKGLNALKPWGWTLKKIGGALGLGGVTGGRWQGLSQTKSEDRGVGDVNSGL